MSAELQETEEAEIAKVLEDVGCDNDLMYVASPEIDKMLEDTLQQVIRESLSANEGADSSLAKLAEIKNFADDDYFTNAVSDTPLLVTTEAVTSSLQGTPIIPKTPALPDASVVDAIPSTSATCFDYCDENPAIVTQVSQIPNTTSGPESAKLISQSPAESLNPKVPQSPSSSNGKGDRSVSPSNARNDRTPSPSVGRSNRSPSPSNENMNTLPSPSNENMNTSPSPCNEKMNTSPSPSNARSNVSPSPSEKSPRPLSPSVARSTSSRSPSPCNAKIVLSPSPSNGKSSRSQSPSNAKSTRSPSPSKDLSDSDSAFDRIKKSSIIIESDSSEAMIEMMSKKKKKKKKKRLSDSESEGEFSKKSKKSKKKKDKKKVMKVKILKNKRKDKRISTSSSRTSRDSEDSPQIVDVTESSQIFIPSKLKFNVPPPTYSFLFEDGVPCEWLYNEVRCLVSQNKKYTGTAKEIDECLDQLTGVCVVKLKRCTTEEIAEATRYKAPKPTNYTMPKFKYVHNMVTNQEINLQEHTKYEDYTLGSKHDEPVNENLKWNNKRRKEENEHEPKHKRHKKDKEKKKSKLKHRHHDADTDAESETMQVDQEVAEVIVSEEVVQIDESLTVTVEESEDIQMETSQFTNDVNEDLSNGASKSLPSSDVPTELLTKTLSDVSEDISTLKTSEISEQISEETSKENEKSENPEEIPKVKEKHVPSQEKVPEVKTKVDVKAKNLDKIAESYSKKTEGSKKIRIRSPDTRKEDVKKAEKVKKPELVAPTPAPAFPAPAFKIPKKKQDQQPVRKAMNQPIYQVDLPKPNIIIRRPVNRSPQPKVLYANSFVQTDPIASLEYYDGATIEDLMLLCCSQIRENPGVLVRWSKMQVMSSDEMTRLRQKYVKEDTPTKTKITMDMYQKRTNELQQKRKPDSHTRVNGDVRRDQAPDQARSRQHDTGRRDPHHDSRKEREHHRDELRRNIENNSRRDQRRDNSNDGRKEHQRDARRDQKQRIESHHQTSSHDEKSFENERIGGKGQQTRHSMRPPQRDSSPDSNMADGGIDDDDAIELHCNDALSVVTGTVEEKLFMKLRPSALNPFARNNVSANPDLRAPVIAAKASESPKPILPLMQIETALSINTGMSFLPNHSMNQKNSVLALQNQQSELSAQATKIESPQPSTSQASNKQEPSRIDLFHTKEQQHTENEQKLRLEYFQKIEEKQMLKDFEISQKEKQLEIQRLQLELTKLREEIFKLEENKIIFEDRVTSITAELNNCQRRSNEILNQHAELQRQLDHLEKYPRSHRIKMLDDKDSLEADYHLLEERFNSSKKDAELTNNARVQLLNLLQEKRITAQKYEIDIKILQDALTSGVPPTLHKPIESISVASPVQSPKTTEVSATPPIQIRNTGTAISSRLIQNAMSSIISLQIQNAVSATPPIQVQNVASTTPPVQRSSTVCQVSPSLNSPVTVESPKKPSVAEKALKETPKEINSNQQMVSKRVLNMVHAAPSFAMVPETCEEKFFLEQIQGQQQVPRDFSRHSCYAMLTGTDCPYTPCKFNHEGVDLQEMMYFMSSEEAVNLYLFIKKKKFKYYYATAFSCLLEIIKQNKNTRTALTICYELILRTNETQPDWWRQMIDALCCIKDNFDEDYEQELKRVVMHVLETDNCDIILINNIARLSLKTFQYIPEVWNKLLNIPRYNIPSEIFNLFIENIIEHKLKNWAPVALEILLNNTEDSYWKKIMPGFLSILQDLCTSETTKHLLLDKSQRQNLLLPPPVPPQSLLDMHIEIPNYHDQSAPYSPSDLSPPLVPKIELPAAILKIMETENPEVVQDLYNGLCENLRAENWKEMLALLKKFKGKLSRGRIMYNAVKECNAIKPVDQTYLKLTEAFPEQVISQQNPRMETFYVEILGTVGVNLMFDLVERKNYTNAFMIFSQIENMKTFDFTNITSYRSEPITPTNFYILVGRIYLKTGFTDSGVKTFKKVPNCCKKTDLEHKHDAFIMTEYIVEHFIEKQDTVKALDTFEALISLKKQLCASKNIDYEPPKHSNSVMVTILNKNQTLKVIKLWKHLKEYPHLLDTTTTRACLIHFFKNNVLALAKEAYLAGKLNSTYPVQWPNKKPRFINLRSYWTLEEVSVVIEEYLQRFDYNYGIDPDLEEFNLTIRIEEMNVPPLSPTGIVKLDMPVTDSTLATACKRTEETLRRLQPPLLYKQYDPKTFFVNNVSLRHFLRTNCK